MAEEGVEEEEALEAEEGAAEALGGEDAEVDAVDSALVAEEVSVEAEDEDEALVEVAEDDNK